MRNKAYYFTVEDNGIYYKDRHLVHKKNSSFVFGELVSSMKQLVSSKRKRVIIHGDDQGSFPTLNTKRKGRRQSDFQKN